MNFMMKIITKMECFPVITNPKFISQSVNFERIVGQILKLNFNCYFEILRKSGAAQPSQISNNSNSGFQK